MMHPYKKVTLVIFFSSLAVFLWTSVKRQVGDLQLCAYLVWPLEYAVAIYTLFNSLFYTYFSLILLWICSGLSFEATKAVEDHLRKQKVQLITEQGLPDKSKLLNNDSLINAEKFIALFQVWLLEEENVTMETEPMEDKIYRLQSAWAQTKRVQIVFDSLQTQAVYEIHSNAIKSQKIYGLLDQFDYIKAYMELRLHLLKLVQKQFGVFLEQGKELKIWLSEALEFQENLHQLPCNSHQDFQQQLALTQLIQKRSEMMKGSLESCESSADKVTATLQELSALSGSFTCALRLNTIQLEEKRWSDTLRNSLMDEMTQVVNRFSTLQKLNTCYQTHLQGLQRPPLNATENPRTPSMYK